MGSKETNAFIVKAEDRGNSVKNREAGADIAASLRALADKWEMCPEVGMMHCDCITDAARSREMAARIMEMVGL